MRVNPLRCARGLATISAVASQFSSAALFNNDTTKYLRVLDGFGSLADGIISTITQTRLTTQATGLIDPVVTGEATPPGLLDTQALVASPAGDFQFQIHNVSGNIAPIWRGHHYPLAVLRPGWSFVLTDLTPNVTISFGFFWEWIWPDELINPHIGDPEIDG